MKPQVSVGNDPPFTKFLPVDFIRSRAFVRAMIELIAQAAQCFYIWPGLRVCAALRYDSLTRITI